MPDANPVSHIPLPHKKDLLAEIIALLKNNRDNLIGFLLKGFRSMIFENRFTLHPSRLKGLCVEEVDQFIAFLSGHDGACAVARGEQQARGGLGERLLIFLGNELRRFLMYNLEDQHPDLVRTCVMLIDDYMSHYLLGYVIEREKLTLKEQEQLRRALSTALERQAHELIIKNHAINTSINGVMITDLEGNITYVNAAFLKMWNVDDAKPLESKKASFFFGISDLRQILQTIMEFGGWQSDRTIKMEDLSNLEISISASMIRDDDDRPIGIMASFSDVTERKRLEIQFRQSQKMEALGQLAGGIVHDFNNLLQIISGFTELELLKLAKDSEEYSDFLQVKIASDRGKDLTSQLRYFTRQASGVRQPISLNTSVGETYNLLKHTFPPDITIEVKLEPNLGVIEADQSQISQMILNLCVNARDAIMAVKRLPDTGESADAARKKPRNVLTLETRDIKLDSRTASRFINAKPGRYVRLQVKDTGTGIKPEIIDRLFEPFFSTKDEKSGTGLGLAVVYGIVQNHKGFIDVRSTFGEGSTFEIYFPVLEKKLTGEALRMPSSTLVEGSGCILVVDDEPQVRDLAVHALKMSGYTVFSAEDGTIALSIFEKKKIDLVILDMVMPRMGGWECFKKLKEIDSGVKVLIVTGYTVDGSAHDLLREGAKGLIEKPFDLDKFTRTVHEVICSPG